jgi:CRP-like cAMP-binding protein
LNQQYCSFKKSGEKIEIAINKLDFRNFIEHYSKLSDEEWQEIDLMFDYIDYEPNEIILNEGEICRYFYFLETGLIRFHNFIDGDDITRTFTIAPYCFTSNISFRRQSPSGEAIQALDKTTVRRISYKNYKKLEGYNSWNMFIRKLLNEIQEFSEAFYLDIRTKTAEQRYLKLIEEYPDEILNKIPLKHLSTFLGIAPQSLSRIRRKFNDKL